MKWGWFWITGLFAYKVIDAVEKDLEDIILIVEENEEENELREYDGEEDDDQNAELEEDGDEYEEYDEDPDCEIECRDNNDDSDCEREQGEECDEEFGCEVDQCEDDDGDCNSKGDDAYATLSILDPQAYFDSLLQYEDGDEEWNDDHEDAAPSTSDRQAHGGRLVHSNVNNDQHLSSTATSAKQGAGRSLVLAIAFVILIAFGARACSGF